MLQIMTLAGLSGFSHHTHSPSRVAFVVVCFASLDTLPEGWTLGSLRHCFSYLLCSLRGRTCEGKFSVVAVSSL